MPIVRVYCASPQNIKPLLLFFIFMPWIRFKLSFNDFHLSFLYCFLLHSSSLVQIFISSIVLDSSFLSFKHFYLCKFYFSISFKHFYLCMFYFSISFKSFNAFSYCFHCFHYCSCSSYMICQNSLSCFLCLLLLSQLVQM